MAKATTNVLAPAQRSDTLNLLKSRFEKFPERHKTINWEAIHLKLEANPAKLWSLHQMENSGGEPDVVGYDATTDEYLFFDCSAESPAGRRSLCYDRLALDARKEAKPKNNAQDVATAMGIQLLTEAQYRALLALGTFDAKTSSWIQTPDAIRNLGGALFADFRYGSVFVYHNGASSYYAGRGFRGWLSV